MQAKRKIDAVSVRKVLPKEALKRRIAGARNLQGLNQRQLGAIFDADGLDETAPGRVERAEIPLQPAALRALAHHLKVPQAWFTVSDEQFYAAIQAGLKPHEEELKRRLEFDPESPLVPGNDPPTEQDEDEDQNQTG